MPVSHTGRGVGKYFPRDEAHIHLGKLVRAGKDGQIATNSEACVLFESSFPSVCLSQPNLLFSHKIHSFHGTSF